MSGPARPWLTPLVPLYRLGQLLTENRKTVQRLNWPVVSIGNLSTGGTGKTPLTIALARALVARCVHVDVLSRGYGRAGTGTTLVQKEDHAKRIGDEPLLIACEAGVPVYVDRERYEAGLLAEAQHRPDGPAVHLLDDGFQHRQLHRDVDILLLNRRDRHDALLPAGNLREELSAVKRADVVAIPADEPELEIELDDSGWRGQIWKLRRRMEIPAVDGPTVAFCGIARPEQFFAGLEAAGVKLAAVLSFPDHHPYTQKDLTRLAATMRSTGASTLLTTEKDNLRLGRMADDLPLRTVGLRTEIEDETAALEWLLERLKSRKIKPAM
ncbi:MAG TPA: tetraacyldisaccharide 4'-kinase [Terracidiphilus sp.]|jgi:tetraacyldisaccharide 4'-kinase